MVNIENSVCNMTAKRDLNFYLTFIHTSLILQKISEFFLKIDSLSRVKIGFICRNSEINYCDLKIFRSSVFIFSVKLKYQD